MAEESQKHVKDLPDSPQGDKHLAWRHLICCFLPGSAWPAVLGVFTQHLTKMAQRDCRSVLRQGSWYREFLKSLGSVGSDVPHRLSFQVSPG